ncbi:MAG: PspA/IM30 family protein [Eubacterium sp.]|nr:PspA/IM30 family protein [Eubacterium sp.]
MGILSRFKDIMASNVNAVFNKEDKRNEKTVRKYLDSLKSDLGQVYSETEAIKVEYKRARMAYDDNVAEQEKLDRYIMKAGESGDTASARQYEARLESVKEEGVTLKQKYEMVKGDMDNLTAMNDKLRDDIATLESKLSEIKAKEMSASKQDPDRILTEMNDKADYIIDKANAMEELNRSSGQSGYDEVASLAEKYDDMDD